MEITRNEIALREMECDGVCLQSKNAVHEILLMMKQMGEMFNRMHAKLFYDLQKYHPDAWQLFIEYKENYILSIIEKNLKRGIEEGLYRENLNVKIMARLRAFQIEMAFNPAIFPPEKFNLVDIQLQMIDHFLRGIATDKGHKMINKYEKKRDEK
jgi:hypothetical protein